MLEFSVKTQIDVIIAAFTLHNYIKVNSQDEAMFNVVEQHPNYIPHDKFQNLYV